SPAEPDRLGSGLRWHGPPGRGGRLFPPSPGDASAGLPALLRALARAGGQSALPLALRPASPHTGLRPPLRWRRGRPYGLRPPPGGWPLGPRLPGPLDPAPRWPRVEPRPPLPGGHWSLRARWTPRPGRHRPDRLEAPQPLIDHDTK